MAAISEKDELQNAVGLLLQGKRLDAKVELLALEPKIKSQNLRIQLIDALLSVLDPLKDNAKLIAFSVEGIEIAGMAGLQDLQAHFMARKADFLMFQVSIKQHRVAMLKLAPSWIEFATEAEKNEYESLVAEITTIEKEVDRLLSDAIAQAEKSGDKRTLGFILMSKAANESSRYLQLKAASMAHGVRAKLWMKFEFMRYPFFEYLITVWNGDSKRLGALYDSFCSSLLIAARLFEEIDDSNAGAAYYNLANNLRTAYQFNLATKYLAKARVIAIKYNDQLVLGQIETLRQRIRDKNRNIPDHSIVS